MTRHYSRAQMRKLLIPALLLLAGCSRSSEQVGRYTMFRGEYGLMRFDTATGKACLFKPDGAWEIQTIAAVNGHKVSEVSRMMCETTDPLAGKTLEELDAAAKREQSSPVPTEKPHNEK